MQGPSYYGLLSGGLMGSDPFDASSWSGSAASLFRAMKEEGILSGASGVRLSRTAFARQALTKISLNREVWRRRVYRSETYRQALSARLSSVLPQDPALGPLLQLGAYVNARKAWGQGKIFTYQDGNGAEYLKSPYTPDAIRQDCRLNAGLHQFERQVAEDADLVLTTSDYLARSFQENYDVPAEKVLSIGCGINVDLPPKAPVRVFECQKLLFIGREFERKGGEDLLLAFRRVRAKFPEAELHIIGPDRRTQGQGVHWHGFLNRDHPQQWQKFRTLLSSATLFVLPSLYEPLGLAPLEAMGWGIPAVVTGAWALEENVTPDQHGAHCQPHAPDELAEIIITLLENPEQLADMGERAQAHVRENFSWQAVAKRLKNLAVNDPRKLKGTE